MVNFQSCFEKGLALFLGEQLSNLAAVLLDQLGGIHQGDAAIFG